MNLRLFVALEPPDLVRRRLAAIQADLKRAAGRALAEIRWIPPENVHLTLQFLGAVLDDRLEDVKTAVAGAALAAVPFHLEVGGAGGFPSARRARVLWAAVGGDVAPLRELVSALGSRLAPIGFSPEERPFSPHLTLGRARDSRGVPGLAAHLAQIGEAPGVSWRATEVVLFQSHLGPGGARYEALARAPLGRAG
ncbi:MAG TPA: RNA 2',3'-cyclic phosphodiesterase [Anaeromyxobacteraceae bacterium]|nr:RNA 2',3'-cyclic phosphodiesterase [Anaeromyxobacteraceae bacterium]